MLQVTAAQHVKLLCALSIMPSRSPSVPSTCICNAVCCNTCRRTLQQAVATTAQTCFIITISLKTCTTAPIDLCRPCQAGPAAQPIQIRPAEHTQYCPTRPGVLSHKPQKQQLLHCQLPMPYTPAAAQPAPDECSTSRSSCSAISRCSHMSPML